MKITVELMAQLRDAAGGLASIELEVDDAATAQDVLLHLAEERGAAFRALVLDDAGRLSPTVLAAAGGRQLRWDEPRALREGDVLLLATPLAGG